MFWEVRNGFYDKLHFFTLFRSKMKMFIWAYYFPASNRPKVLKSRKSAENRTFLEIEHFGTRKPSINDSVLKGLGVVPLIAELLALSGSFSHIMLF